MHGTLKVALATITATLLLAAPALAAPDRKATLSASAPELKWDGAAATTLGGVIGFSEDDPEINCSQDIIGYCDRTLLKLEGTGELAVNLSGAGDGVSDDFDVFVYAATPAGAPSKLVGKSENAGEPEKVTVKQATGSYLVYLWYYTSVGGAPSGASAKFTATGPAVSPPGAPATPPVSRIDKISSTSAKKLKGFSGVAAPGTGATLSKVEISLTRLDKGKCSSLTASGSFKSSPKKGSQCVPTTFVAATGTSKWTFKLKKALKKGSYKLFSRATDSSGATETTFGARNSRSFKVK